MSRMSRYLAAVNSAAWRFGMVSRLARFS